MDVGRVAGYQITGGLQVIEADCQEGRREVYTPVRGLPW